MYSVPPSQALFALRVYAIYGQNRQIAAVMGSLILARLAMDIVVCYSGVY